MKYWQKGNGECGTMDDNGSVPGSVEVSKEVYDEYVANMPVIIPIDIVYEFEDVDTGKLYNMRKIS